MTTLDIRKLEAWQLDEAQAIWREFSNRMFMPFYQCAIDPARIELDERVHEFGDESRWVIQRQQLVKRRRQQPHLLSVHVSKRHLLGLLSAGHLKGNPMPFPLPSLPTFETGSYAALSVFQASVVTAVEGQPVSIFEQVVKAQAFGQIDQGHHTVVPRSCQN